MSYEEISESGMTFGPFPADTCLKLEENLLYTRLQQHVKMAEFLVLKKVRGVAAIWIIEAKSSSPMPGHDGFKDFLGTVKEKFENALHLYMAVLLGRHGTAESLLPVSLRHLDLDRAEFKFVLVIRGHQKGWLVPLQDGLNMATRPLQKTWSKVSIVVLNDQMARAHGLVKAEAEATGGAVQPPSDVVG